MTAPAVQNPFHDFVRQYQHDSVAFVREVIGVEPYPDQIALLRAYDRGERQIAKRSGHGVGKSTATAWVAVHHILFRYPQKTVITSASAPQLWDALAAEVKSTIKRLPTALSDLLEVQSEGIYLKADPDGSFISFRVSKAETPEAMAGVHSQHVLLIPDEASGIPDPVFQAASGSMSGEHAITIMCGNPIRSSGFFFDAFHADRANWWTQHVSCEGHPNVTPKFVESMKARYGEDSNAYRVRVLGEFPLADDDTVIPFETAESALSRDVQPSLVRPIWGVDCARFGSDASALCKRQGNTLTEPTQIRQGYDTMKVVGWIKAEWDKLLPSERPTDINVDVIGIGAGVCDRLSELGLPARGINVAESAAMTEQFANLRSELWFKGADWLGKRDCSLAKDDALMAELVQPRFSYLSNGKRLVESKQDMKKRGVKSPNRADAFLLTLASEAVTASGQSKTRQAWSEPLKRPIAGIV